MIRRIHIIAFFIGLIGTLFGLVFRIMHWPGAQIMMLSGFSIIEYIFTPIYFSVKIKKHEKRFLRIFDFISIFTLINLSTGAILKLIDSEIGYYISLIGLISLTGFFIPVLTYIIVKDKNNRLKRLIVLGASVIYFVANFYTSSFIDLKPQKLDTFSIIDNAQNNQMTQYQQNLIDYVDLLKNHPEKDKIKKLKYKSDSISNYIQDLKTEIVKKCSDNDSLLNYILFEQGKASDLKLEIVNYKTFIKTVF